MVADIIFEIANKNTIVNYDIDEFWKGFFRLFLV